MCSNDAMENTLSLMLSLVYGRLRLLRDGILSNACDVPTYEAGQTWTPVVLSQACLPGEILCVCCVYCTSVGLHSPAIVLSLSALLFSLRANKQDDQKGIYYVTADSRDSAKKSPALEKASALG